MLCADLARLIFHCDQCIDPRVDNFDDIRFSNASLPSTLFGALKDRNQKMCPFL